MNQATDVRAVVNEAIQQIEQAIRDAENNLMDEETVNGEMATTNATGFTLDEVEVLSINASNRTRPSVKFSYKFSGDQDDEKPFSGDAISGEGTALLGLGGAIEFEDVTATRNLD